MPIEVRGSAHWDCCRRWADCLWQRIDGHHDSALDEHGFEHGFEHRRRDERCDGEHEALPSTVVARARLIEREAS